ncbi:MAG: NADH-quinone oxidoreductase subunit C [Alphaproteobacteria bacterium]|jgi:NADH-quinone oxidoreductase subunit C|nr:NADH-quinone oxidoreductase subunit C [Alphaproteobacteria bacterium]PPR12636.1 MAG: NADH-quinone oxidoreductase chain 5 [Alphaproteobacteria bacterium MarineAlpha12_Bin1]|tara:strand:+ start:1282 stop:1905 length:624 start_codon:yes stop_codon:yes gene_type:complete
MDQALKDLGTYITTTFKEIENIEFIYDELVLTVSPLNLNELLQFLRSDTNCQFKVLIDICGADYPQREKRFEVIYNLLSMSQNQRVRVKVMVDENTPVPTSTNIYSAASWFEREAWDLYGIVFSGHKDLRRLLTDYGFEGHPLRKDFPLTGRVEVRYDETQKRVVYDPVQLTQDFRTFDFLSPWEGMNRQLPGDEKAINDDKLTEDG